MWQDVDTKYFNWVRGTALSLRSTVKWASKDEDVMDEAKRAYAGIIGEANDLFPLLFFDLGICCKALGKGMNLADKESLLFYMAMVDRDGTCTLESVQNASPELVGHVQELANTINSTLEGRGTEKCSFLIESVLRNADNDAVTRYIHELNQVSNIIAKADGTVTEEEARWLSFRFGSAAECRDPLPDIVVKYRPTEEGQLQDNATGIDRAESTIDLHYALDKLDRLIGLRTVKEEIHSLVNFAEAQRRREEMGLKPLKVAMHCVFTGNPGTGKTTVARILGNIYKGMGLIDSGKVVEVDRSALCGGFVGQTAIKTNEVINSALGGVLFIDEAYSLANRGENDFGQEAISTLIKRMEDDRDRLVVILAGYSKEMEAFLNSNPGLRSRFSKHIRFEDYSAPELSDILALMLKDNDYRMTHNAWARINIAIASAVLDKPKDFGNARYVRNLFERLLQNQANRVAYIPSVTPEILSTIEEEDVMGL